MNLVRIAQLGIASGLVALGISAARAAYACPSQTQCPVGYFPFSTYSSGPNPWFTNGGIGNAGSSVSATHDNSTGDYVLFATLAKPGSFEDTCLDAWGTFVQDCRQPANGCFVENTNVGTSAESNPNVSSCNGGDYVMWCAFVQECH
ncbi:MAG TPA: hypothetical protein VKU41_02380 [Polyangiaceae bacterium]|nr:hypothetical protein [Polyangiaceae bacterium]